MNSNYFSPSVHHELNQLCKLMRRDNKDIFKNFHKKVAVTSFY